MKNLFNWDVQTDDIIVRKQDTGYKAIVRNDNNAILGIKGSRYVPYGNAQLSEFAERVASTTDMTVDGSNEFRGGKIVMVQLKNPHTYNVCGHDMKANVIIGTSHDGTKPLFIGTSSTYIRCQNQFGSIHKLMKARHNSLLEMRVEEICQIMEGYYVKWQTQLEWFEKMSKVKIDPKLREGTIKMVLGKTLQDINESGRESLMAKANQLIEDIEVETTDLGDNLWGLFNGVTKYTTHHMNNRVKDQFRMFDKGADINNLVFNKLQKAVV